MIRSTYRLVARATALALGLVAVAVACALVGVSFPGAENLRVQVAELTGPQFQVTTTPDADAGVSFMPSAEEIDMAIAVLTQPDSGAVGGTNRWAQSSVTYSLDAISHYPIDYLTQVRSAFSFAATATGLEVREVHGSADVTVTAKSGNGAYTTADVSGGRIHSVILQLGCCRARPVWEDVLQAFGPMGDHADSRSVFSQDHTLQQASEFDAWVLHVLYANPPGTRADALRSQLFPAR